MSAVPQALGRLRIVEFGGYAAGPHIGKMLANFGATVVHVESRARPDGFRLQYPPYKDGKPGVDAGRSSIASGSIVELPEILVHVAEVVMGLRLVGLQSQRLATRGERLVQVPLFQQCVAEIGLGFRIVGLERDGLSQCGDRFV